MRYQGGKVNKYEINRHQKFVKMPYNFKILLNNYLFNIVQYSYCNRTRDIENKNQNKS